MSLDGKTDVVVKFINVEKIETEEEKEYCRGEPKLLKDLQKLKHKNLMEMYYWFTDLNGSIVIVSPYYKG